MKKIILIFLTALFIGCDTAPTGIQVTFDDEKSNAIRAHYQNYLNNDVEALQSLWSPDLNIYINSTEAAGVGAAGAMLLAWSKGALSLPVIREVIDETSRTTAFIFGAIIGAVCFTLVLRGLGGDELIERTLMGLPFGATGIIISILIATFILGFFLDWIELTLILLPLVAPVVAALNFDPIWFTVMFAVCLQTSFLTPPVGGALFYLKGIAPEGIDLPVIYRGVVPFIVLQLIALAILFQWEAIVTWLPGQAY